MRRWRRPPAGLRLPPALEAGERVLRPWREADVTQLVEACQDPGIIRFTRVPTGYDERDAREYVRSRELAAGEGTAASLAVAAAQDPERLLGSVSLFAFAARDRRAEIGYWIAPDARGRGHAVGAVRGMVAWGFDALGLERVQLLAATVNPASQRVAERAGFTREAVLRRYWHGKAEQLDMVCYGRLCGEGPGEGRVR